MPSPIDWTTLQGAILTEVEGSLTEDGLAADRVIWSDQDNPVGPRPFVRLRASGGTDFSPHKVNARTLEAQAWRVIVGIAAVQTYTVTVLGADAAYLAGGGDTTTDIRDALVPLVDAWASVTAAAEAGSTPPALIITADVAGENLFVSVDPDPDITTAIVTDAMRTTQTVPSEFTVAVSVFSVYDDAGPTLAQHARNLAEAIAAHLGKEGPRSRLRDVNLAYVSHSGVLNLSTLEGSQMETRATVDLLFRTTSATVEQTGVAESAPVLNDC